MLIAEVVHQRGVDSALKVRVAGRLCQGQRGKFTRQRLLLVSHTRIHSSNAAKSERLATPVLDVAPGGQRLVIKFERFVLLPQGGIGSPRVGKRRRLAAAVSSLSPEGQRLA